MYFINSLRKLFGKDWNSFYCWLLDNIEKKNTFKNIKSQRRAYGFYSLTKGDDLKDVLIKNGLKKNHNFLDFGCGYGRIGIPIIKYLNKNKYVGLDLSQERIRLAQEYVEEEKLRFKKPIFLSSHKKKLADLIETHKFDVILIYTVIGHNPLENVKIIISSLLPYLKKNGCFYFDYSRPSKKDHYMRIAGYQLKLSVKDYRHTDLEINSILKELDLKAKVLKYKDRKGHKWQLNKSYSPNRKFVKVFKNN